MILKYEQTVDDVIDLQKNSLKKNKVLKLFLIFFGGILMINFILSSNPMFSDGIQFDYIFSWIAPMAIVAFVWILFFKYYYPKFLLKKGDKNMLIGDRVLELSDENIKLSTPSLNSEYKWSLITELRESSKNYFLFLGASQAIIVSKNAFNNESEMMDFENMVNSKIEKQ